MNKQMVFKFAKFCARHGITFASMVEYQAALEQFCKD